MPLKSASSKIAIAAAAAFALGSTAMAQTMVGDQEIVDDADMQLVEEHCAELTDAADTLETDDTATDDLAADDEDPATDDLADDTATDDLADDAATDDLAADTETDDLAEDGETSSGILDLAAITAEDCEAAGIGSE